MQIMRVPPGNMSNGSSNGSRPYKIGNRSAVKDLDREVGIDHTDHLSEVWKYCKGGGRRSPTVMRLTGIYSATSAIPRQ